MPFPSDIGDFIIGESPIGGPVSGADISPWTNLITSEHNQQPNFMSTLAALLQPLADTMATVSALPASFDIDTAIGAQLDIDGLWVNQGRQLPVPLTGVYFSLDVAGLGLDQGTLYQSFDPLTELDTLPDDSYRILLKAKIASNHWDGSTSKAENLWNTLFAAQGYQILIQDAGATMHILVGISSASGNVDAVTKALLTGGYLALRPIGVQIDSYVTPSGTPPFFGLDVENAIIAGPDVGSWAIPL